MYNDNNCVKPETLTMSSIQCIMLHEQYAIYVLVYVHMTKKYCICTQPVFIFSATFLRIMPEIRVEVGTASLLSVHHRHSHVSHGTGYLKGIVRRKLRWVKSSVNQ
jgi:hypothetical protein